MSVLTDDKKYDIVVIDSAAFIHGAKIEYSGKSFYTISEVLEEIKDKQARGFLQQFPYEIKIKDPSDESIKTVAEFARATGDLIHISKVDLKVMALTYQLEVEMNGSSHIFTKPVDVTRYFEGGSELRTVGVNVSEHMCEYFYSEGGCRFGNGCRNRHPGDVIPKSLRAKLLNLPEEKAESEKTETPVVQPTEEVKPEVPAAPKKVFTGWNVPVFKSDEKEEEDFPSLEEAMKDCNKEDISKEMKESIQKQFAIHKSDFIVKKEEEEAEEPVVDIVEEHPLEREEKTSTSSSKNQSRVLVNNTIATTVYIDENDNEGWASADNLNDGWGNWDDKKDEENEEEEEEDYHHAVCCTADFTMQNVLIQMGLRILSIEGLRIKTARLWTYRCRCCNEVCRDMTKLFCPSCGLDSLCRVPLIIDKRGRTRIGEIRGNANLRGTIYPISKANMGLGGLLLSADQLETGIWKQRLRQNRAKNGNGLEGMNELLTETFGSYRNPNSSNIVVGYGRKNPNAMKGRERRGKKHRHH